MSARRCRIELQLPDGAYDWTLVSDWKVRVRTYAVSGLVLYWTSRALLSDANVALRRAYERERTARHRTQRSTTVAEFTREAAHIEPAESERKMRAGIVGDYLRSCSYWRRRLGL